MSSKELALKKTRELANGKELDQIAHAVSNQTHEQQFLALVKVWKDERGPHSSSARLCAHPAYQQIIGMGPQVVPLLLRELKRQPDHWFRALHALTGVDPVPPASRGKIGEMAEAWSRWGVGQGYQT